MAPIGRAAFDFPAMTYFQERARERVPYITLFPIGDRMRANLFAYRAADDPWLRAIRRTPVDDDQCRAAAAAAAHRGLRSPG